MRERRPTPKRAKGPPGVAMTDRGSARLSAAMGLWRQGRQLDASALFDEAMRLEPNNVQAYIVAARAYGERFEFDRMEQVLAKLVRRAPRHPGVHHYIGETYGALKLPHRALASYETAARLPGAGPPTWMELASLYERAHRLDEAEEMIERAVRAGYSLPLVWLVRGRIQRRQKRLTDAEASFHKAIERGGAASDWSCEAWSELALMKDAEGDFEAAIDAIEQCKRAQRSREGPHWAISEHAHRSMKQLVDDITQADFRR
jgi:tetratricopeptide (TPR) repeat protein